MTQRLSSGLRRAFTQSPWQLAAFVFCFLIGIAIVINVQLAGDAEWFFYANLLHHGVRLYRDLHLPLQPFFVLETSAWMHLFGIKTLAYESLSLIHIFLVCLGMHLLLRESDWTDARKAVLFLAAFFVNFDFVGVRFDDFHVICDICALFSIYFLLRLSRTLRPAKLLLWAASAGVLCGISFTDRATEGLMLLVASVACAPFLAQRRKLVAAAIVLLAAAATVVGVVILTGDTLHDYAAYSIFHAAAAKGGNSSVFRLPLAAVIFTLKSIWHNKGSAWFLVLLAAGAFARRYIADTARAVLSAELLCAAVLAILVACKHSMRKDLTNAAFIFSFDILIQNLIYPLCLLVLYRGLRSWRQRKSKPPTAAWDAREILILFAGTNLIAVAASQGIGTSNGTFGLVLFLLLSHLWMPQATRFRWLCDTWIAIAVVLSCSGLAEKVFVPYAWGVYTDHAMFQQRQWIRHPVYGPMYIEKDLLQFIKPLCDEMHAVDPQPELLSMPYSYANYFCATPPWRNYVQTWFDTTEPDTVRALEQQLNQSPPKWILYQRQLESIKGHEMIYHHGEPIEHRKLDELIMSELSSGRWKLIDKRDYLLGDGWYLIQTHS